ncbi:MAG: PilZ domain-containing protein [Candidatus Omnitrophica bacterium]|nr:PilZ domain-containing protein [Candidatus Omnitrophota bacterium]
MAERRKFMRFNTDLPIEYNTGDKKSAKGVCRGTNVSREGLMIRAGRAIKKGVELNLRMIISESKSVIMAQGTVVWSAAANGMKDKKDYEAGVKLTKIDSFDRACLLEYAYDNWLDEVSKKK